jgi:hypothetical protein
MRHQFAFQQRTPQPIQNPRDGVALALSIIERLRRTLADELVDIRRRERVDYDGYNLRKNQALLELNRIAANIRSNENGNAILQNAVLQLKVDLEENQRELQLQLAAARAVSNIITKAIRDAQSDGTYSALSWWGSEA